MGYFDALDDGLFLGRDGAPGAVLYSEQDLTPAQREQARANIGAEESGSVAAVTEADVSGWGFIKEVPPVVSSVTLDSSCTLCGGTVCGGTVCGSTIADVSLSGILCGGTICGGTICGGTVNGCSTYNTNICGGTIRDVDLCGSICGGTLCGVFINGGTIGDVVTLCGEIYSGTLHNSMVSSCMVAGGGVSGCMISDCMISGATLENGTICGMFISNVNLGGVISCEGTTICGGTIDDASITLRSQAGSTSGHLLLVDSPSGALSGGPVAFQKMVCGADVSEALSGYYVPAFINAI